MSSRRQIRQHVEERPSFGSWADEVEEEEMLASTQPKAATAQRSSSSSSNRAATSRRGAAPPHVPPRMPPNVPPRMQKFLTCVSDNRQRRSEAGLSGVTYSDTMTDEEIEALRDMFVGIGRGDVRRGVSSLLTYAGMHRAAAVLCRWPRPSELARVIKAAGLGQMQYRIYKVVFNPVAGVDVGEIVGKLGANLIRITEEHDLLYAWVHTSKGVGELYLYSIGRNSMAKCMAAENDFFKSRKAVKQGKAATSMKTFTVKMDNWMGQK